MSTEGAGPNSEEIAASVRSDDRDQRLRAIETLEWWGEAAQPAVPALLELFGREVGDDEICAALRALGAIPWGAHRKQASSVLCALVGYAIVHAGGVRAVSALRRWYPEGPDSVSYHQGGLARFLDGHEIAIALLDALASHRVVPKPIELVLEWLHPYGLDEGRPGRRWAEAILASTKLGPPGTERLRAALDEAARQERAKTEGFLMPAPRYPGLIEKPTDACKPFVLAGRAIDFEPSQSRTHHRITVDGDPVRMTYEEIIAGVTSSGAHAPRVRVAEQSMPWLALKELLEAPEPFVCKSAREAVCAWKSAPGECAGTIVYSSDEVSLEFDEDWTAVKITWRDWSDTSA